MEAGSLTKAQFIQRADEICKSGRRQMEAEYAKYAKAVQAGPDFKAFDRAHAAELMNTIIVPAYEEQIDRVSSLGAPSGDEEEVSSILIAIQRALEEGEDHPTKFLHGVSFPEALKMARAYGLTVCAT